MPLREWYNHTSRPLLVTAVCFSRQTSLSCLPKLLFDGCYRNTLLWISLALGAPLTLLPYFHGSYVISCLKDSVWTLLLCPAQNPAATYLPSTQHTVCNTTPSLKQPYLLCGRIYKRKTLSGYRVKNKKLWIPLNSMRWESSGAAVTQPGFFS